LCVDGRKLEYTGYFAGSVPPTRELHEIDCKARTALDANYLPDTLYIISAIAASPASGKMRGYSLQFVLCDIQLGFPASFLYRLGMVVVGMPLAANRV
jgi:hypothetical protein